MELNTPLELMDIDDLNKGLRSLVITAAVQLQRSPYQRGDKMFSLLCLDQLSYKHTKRKEIPATQDE
ncbi:unnamed protein product [Cuscuta campestris]|uniref:Uncharacterized protein n=1 Tax=Cuscuta campestris TaxID=132261 RepID=A0A484MVV2_9ASTE|nr:unnamed protein product [Cuscuta campestris]